MVIRFLFLTAQFGKVACDTLHAGRKRTRFTGRGFGNMSMTSKLLKLSGAAAVAMLYCGAAVAGGSLKDEPVEEASSFTYSFNIGVISDYRFRGISQSSEDPTLFGGVDIGYGIFYAGVWAAGLDFSADGAVPPFIFGEDAEVEIDVYAGIKPVLGPVTFDLAVLGYLYPSASDVAGELDYVEFKLFASATPFTNFSIAGGVYISPEYSGELGSTVTPEFTAAYTLPAFGPITPAVSGTVGAVTGDDAAFQAFFGDDKYVYWNAGISFTIEKITLDFRYWDTDIDVPPAICCNLPGGTFNAEEQFVASVKIVLP